MRNVTKFSLIVPTNLFFVGDKRLLRERSERNTENREDMIYPLELTTSKQGKSPYKRSFEEGVSQPQTKKKKIDLIFKDVLEASLETTKIEEHKITRNSTPATRKSSRFQAHDVSESSGTGIQHSSPNHSRSRNEGEWKVPRGSSFTLSKDIALLEDEGEEPLSFKLNSPTDLSLASAQDDALEIPTTSLCPNCIRLKKKIRELQAELNMLRSGKLAEPPLLPPQVPEYQAFSYPTGKSFTIEVLLKHCTKTDPLPFMSKYVSALSVLGNMLTNEAMWLGFMKQELSSVSK